MEELERNATPNKGEETRQYCGFKVDGEFYGIPVLDVQEIVKPQPITTVPLSQNHIQGLMNLRGQIVTLISLRRLFGLEPKRLRESMNVIIKKGEGLASLVVDEICDTMDVPVDSFESTPETIPSYLKPYVLGIHKLEDDLMIVLDLDKLIVD